MKKMFNHTKRPDKKDISWKEWEDYEEGAYAEDEEPYDGEGEYYAEDEETYDGEGEYYAEEEETYDGEGEYCAEEEETYDVEGEYCAEEEETYDVEGEYYAEEEETYDGEGEYCTEEEETYDGEGEYCAEEEETYDGEGEYCAEEEETYDGEGEYCAEEEETYDGAGEYCAEEEETYDVEGEYCAEEEESYDGEGEYYAQGEGFYDGEGEIIYEDDDLYNADYRGEQNRADKSKGTNAEGGLIRKLKEMPLMDRMIAGTGVAVLVLALVTVAVLVSSRNAANQVSDFVSVGTQLEDIELIGKEGLLAVADAQVARLEAAAIVWEPEETEPPVEEDEPGYEENEYSRQVTVEMNMTSIQKDLKIKFTNSKTGKLVANVPFSVTVTDPDGKTSIWSDDDMDGIIYKKDIMSGTYKVAMETLSDEKYAGYSISTTTRSAEVKKDIAYEKVDVANEVKTEAEVDARKEDTAQNETVVESVLQDTVAWVESTVVGVSYIEVPKSEIKNPLEILTVVRGLDKSFWRMTLQSNDVTITAGSGQEIQAGDTTQLTAGSPVIKGESNEKITVDEVTDVNWKSDKSAVASVDGNGLVTGIADGEAVIQYTATAKVTVTKDTTASTGPSVSGGDAAGEETTSGTQTETRTETIQVSGKITITVGAGQTGLVKGTITADKTTLATVVGGIVTAQVTAKDFTADKKLIYEVSSDKGTVATAAVDTEGKVTVTGVAAGTAEITVTANYEKDGTDETAAQAVIVVTVGENKVIELSSKSTLAYVNNPLILDATVKGASTTAPTITVESSDTTVMKAVLGTLKSENKVIKVPITLELLKEGSATLTVKCLENGEEVKETCVVTVKANPREDRKTLLTYVDKEGKSQQLYVVENGEYRQATYADYYTYDKFYVGGTVKYTGWQTINGSVYYFTAEGKAVTGEQVIQGAKYAFASDGKLVTGNGTMGIDVSKWNGAIDWNAVKNSGISYVIIRCGYRGSSQGALIEDPKYKANIKGATAAGLKVGVYFFTQAVDEREAVEEASMVLGLIKNYQISYPVFLDVESSGGRADSISKETRTAVCRAFCQTIQNAGYTAGIYANKTWLDTKMDAGALSAYKIWLAQYVQTPTYTGRYDLWQYRATGKVSGISGNVDMNLSYLGY